MGLKEGFTLLRDSGRDFLDDDCPTQAAALSYYTIFSLPALLVLILFGAVGLLGIIAVVAVCVYLVDVRPRVEEVQRRRW